MIVVMNMNRIVDQNIGLRPDFSSDFPGRTQQSRGGTIVSAVKMISFLACLCLAIAGCAGGAQVADGSPVRSSVSGVIAVPKDDRRLGIYVEVEGSKESTELLRAALVQRGYKIDENDTEAAYKLKVIAVFIGAASDRPKVGESEKNPIYSGNEVFWRIGVAGVAEKLSGGGPASPTYWIDMAVAATGADRAFDDLVLGRRTQKPQEAIVTVLELTHGAAVQKAEVLTESYAEKVPLGLMWADNLRMAVWFLE